MVTVFTRLLLLDNWSRQIMLGNRDGKVAIQRFGADHDPTPNVESL